MKTMKNLTAFLAATALLLSACSQPLTTGQGSVKGTSKGTLAISIPAVAPWLAQALAKKAPGSRAYLHAAKAEVSLLSRVAETGDPSKDWEVVAGPQTLTVSTDGSSVSGEVSDLPPGRGYRLKVDLWASETDPSPTLEGIADDVWVDANNTNSVGVGCLPLNPVTTDLKAAASPWTINGTISGAGGESWYAFPVKPMTGYQISVVSDSGIQAFGFSSDGRIQFNSSPLPDGKNNTWWFDNGDGKPFYVGVTGTQAGGFTVTVKEVVGSPVKGTIQFPDGSQGKRFRLILDGPNGYHWSNLDHVWDQLSRDYYMSSVPPGTYTLFCKIDASNTWSDDWNASDGAALAGDLVAPVQTVTVDGTGTVTAGVIDTFAAATGVVWNEQKGQFALEDGAHLVVSVDSSGLGDALVTLWNSVHPEAAGKLTYVNIGSDGALQHNRNHDSLRSDVALTIANPLPSFQQNLLAVDDHLAGVEAELNQSLLAWSNGSFGGPIKALPISYDGMAFAWNQSMLSALGYDVTTDANQDGIPDAFDTWEKIFAISQAWTNPTYHGKTVTVVYPLSLQEVWSGYAGITAGGWRIFSEGDVARPGFDQPGFLAGLQFLKEASSAGVSKEGDGTTLTPGSNMGWRWDQFLGNYGTDQNNQPITGPGLSPFGMVGTWMDITGSATQMGDVIQIGPMPTWNGHRPAPFLKAKSFVIDRGTAYPSAATELLRVLFSKDGIQTLVDHSAYVPTLKEGSGLTPAYGAGAPQPQLAAAFKTSAIEPVTLTLPSGRTAMDLYYNIGINQDYANVWDGSMTPEQAQADVVAKAASWLAAN